MKSEITHLARKEIKSAARFAQRPSAAEEPMATVADVLAELLAVEPVTRRVW